MWLCTKHGFFSIVEKLPAAPKVMGGMGAYVEANCPAFEPAELVFQAENI